MRAYHFRLDSVLRVRRLQERVATQKLAAAVRDLEQARIRSAQARHALEDVTAPVGRLTIGDLRWSHAQSGRLSETARAKAEMVEEAVAAAQQANQAWGSARQRTATLERLDERHLALWRIALERGEAAVLDYLATRRPGGEGTQL